MEALAMQPLYTAISCRSAYQLNWSVTLFGAVDLPLQSGWLNKLRAVTEPESVSVTEPVSATALMEETAAGHWT